MKDNKVHKIQSPVAVASYPITFQRSQNNAYCDAGEEKQSCEEQGVGLVILMGPFYLKILYDSK